MSEFGQLLEIIFQGIFNTWNTMRNIEFLGTNLLVVTVTFLIANALVSLMIVQNNASIHIYEAKERKKGK